MQVSAIGLAVVFEEVSVHIDTYFQNFSFYKYCSKSLPLLVSILIIDWEDYESMNFADNYDDGVSTLKKENIHSGQF